MTFELDTLSYALLGSIVSAAALLSIRNARTPDIHPLLLNSQSDVSRVRYHGSTAIYRSRMYPNGSPLLSTVDRTITTIQNVYDVAFEKYSTLPCVGVAKGKHVSWHTFDSIHKKSKRLTAGLLYTTNLEPRTGTEATFVGIYAANSPDALAVSIGCQSNGLATVPISAQATSSHLSHVIRSAKLRVLVVDADLVDRVLSLITGRSASVKHLIVIGELHADAKETADAAGILATSLSALEMIGSEHPISQTALDPSDIASIYFTNKDTREGSASGVILTHKNLLAVASSYLVVMPPQQRITSKDKLMHNFTIDQVLGHILTLVMHFAGGSVAYGPEIGQGNSKVDVTAMLAYAEAAKVSVYSSGTCFLNQVKTSIETRYGNSFLFSRGLNKKLGHFDEGRLITDSKYDMLVFRDIKQKTFGSNLRLFLVEHDDSVPSLATFLGAVMGTQVLMTFNRPETSGTATMSMFYDYKADPSAVGAPLPCNELKLEDVPDRGLFSSDEPNPRGEILIRGNNVFAGYWNNATASAEVVDGDSWYATSMLGEILPNGTLKILGPK